MFKKILFIIIFLCSFVFFNIEPASAFLPGNLCEPTSCPGKICVSPDNLTISCLNKTAKPCTGILVCDYGSSIFSCEAGYCALDDEGLKKYNETTINCGPSKKQMCRKINTKCTGEADCRKITSDKGIVACEVGYCFLDDVALLAYNTSVLSTDLFKDLKPPKLNIRIPNVTFTELIDTITVGSDGARYLHIPWIGQYITAVYSYSVAMVSIVAVVMLIIQGMAVMTSAGGERKATAYKRIVQIIIGVSIMWTSYFILYSINPDLVEFKALKVRIIETVDLETIDKGDQEKTVASCSNKLKIEDTKYDAIFKKHATAKTIDWHILKAMAFMESGLDAECVNEIGFTGLFQFKESSCRKEGLGNKCKELKNPDYNTEAGANSLKKNIASVKKYCPKIDETSELFYTLLYMAHNSGPGSIICATQTTCGVETTEGVRPLIKVTVYGGCSLGEVETGIKGFWAAHWKTLANLKGADAGRGQRTYDYSLKTGKLMKKLVEGI